MGFTNVDSGFSSIMNPEDLEICQSEWEIVQREEATQTSNISIERVLKSEKPKLPLPRNLSKVDKSANTSFKSSVTVLDFCQVIEKPDDDHKNIKNVISTPSDDTKNSLADGESTLSDRSERRNNYCKDIIKPFLKPDCPESEEEILNNAIDSLTEDFPDYQPCEFPDSDKERTRACLSLGKIEICTSINTKKSNMENSPVETVSNADTKIEVEISTVPLNCLVDAQALIPPETEEKTIKKTCSCQQMDECIKPVMEICDDEDKKDKTENPCPEIKSTSCVCITVTTSSKTRCDVKKSKESIKKPNNESSSTLDCLTKEPNKELNKGSNKESPSTFDCLTKESNSEPNNELKKESNKESPWTFDCSQNTPKETNKEPNKELNKVCDIEPTKESPSKPECDKNTSQGSITKIRIECKSSNTQNNPPSLNTKKSSEVVPKPVSNEKCNDESGPTIEGFVDALDAHTKTITTIKEAMQDFVGKVYSSKQASDKESKTPKNVSSVEKVFDVSDGERPKLADVIRNMKLKVDSTLSMINDSIEKMTPDVFKTPDHSAHDLTNDNTQDLDHILPPASVIPPVPPVPVANSMFYTIKDKIVSMFREPKSNISTRTSTFTNSSLESNDEADSSKAP